MKKYALIGAGLSHSVSDRYHNLMFSKEKIDAEYELMSISEDKLAETIALLREGKYFGYNVTMPYKIQVIPYLDEMSSEAIAIGSVNTIDVKNGKLIGYNTDYYGIIETFRYNKVDIKNVDCYILGTGGASLSAREAIKFLGGKPIFVSRNKKNKENTIDYSDLEKINKIKVLVNSTPVGMYPNIEESPVSEDIINKCEFVFDMIYNPKETKLLRNCKHGANGFMMFIAQGLKSEEIWQGRRLNIDLEEIYNEMNVEVK